MSQKICVEATKESGLKTEDIKNYSQVARDAVNSASKILMKHYCNINTIKSKSTEGDLVTNADLETEEFVISFLKDKTPSFGIYAEESGATGPEDGFVWCIDPLDGTTNYTHGFPFFGCSIALIWNNKPILGSISLPYFDQTFWAAPGIGSYCNENEIHVSSTRKLKESLLASGFAYDRHNVVDNNYAEYCSLTHKTRGVRRAGAAAIDLAFVANGIFDGYWERGLSAWDIAAGIPIVELAGGVISDYKNEEFNLKTGRIVATNPFIQYELISELRKIKPLDPKSYDGTTAISS